MQVRILPLLGILILSICMQGCLAVVWLGAVGIDASRSSEIEFQPFENSWLAPAENRGQLESVTSIAVAPFLERTPAAERMEARWTGLLEQTTGLHVVGPSEVARQLQPDVLAKLMSAKTDQDKINLAPRISAASQVNCVLFGRIVEEQQEKSLGGLKENYSRRLYLYLASADGTLVWKDELPFRLVRGAKDLDEQWATKALTAHVLTHARELGLTELGLQFKKAETSS